MRQLSENDKANIRNRSIIGAIILALIGISYLTLGTFFEVIIEFAFVGVMFYGTKLVMDSTKREQSVNYGQFTTGLLICLVSLIIIFM